MSPSFAQKQSKKNYQAGDVLKEGYFGFRGQKLLLDQAGCPVQWLVVAQRSVRRAKVELCSCNGCGCPLREMLLKMLPRHRAPVDLIKI